MKVFLKFFILILLIFNLNAQNRSIEDAQIVAKNYLSQYILRKDLKILENNNINFRKLNSNNNLEYYIINFKEGGWVIVSKNDINTPILAYSTKSKLDLNFLPPQFSWWLKSINKELKNYTDINRTQLIKNRYKWQELSSSNYKRLSKQYRNTSSKVEPLINTNWGQGRGFNELTPYDSNSVESNKHVPAGCVATAMAQIMNYFAWPHRGYGSKSYTPYSHPEYGRLSVNFGATNYNWSSSSNHALITYHAGVSVGMNYGPYGSASYITDASSALSNYFKYTNSGVIRKSSVSEQTWHSMLQNSLNRKSPVIYQGKGNIVHVFICDGYRKDSSGYLYHFNWGWRGDANGWFRIGAISPKSNYTFNLKNLAIFNIWPNDSNYKLTHKSSGSLFILIPILLLILPFTAFFKIKNKK